jgi:hypothetical protein
MPRTPLLNERQAGWFTRLAYGLARRRFGQVPEPFQAAANHRRLMWAGGIHELLVERGARRTDPELRSRGAPGGDPCRMLVVRGLRHDARPQGRVHRAPSPRTWPLPRLGDAGVVKLTYMIALENMRARTNHALGITAQGYTSDDACPIPLDDQMRDARERIG